MHACSLRAHGLQCYARARGDRFRSVSSSEVPSSRSKADAHAFLRAKAAALAAAISAVLILAAAAPASAGDLAPQGKKIFFGISDTGDPANFGEFSKLTHKHPALIETFRTWGTDFPDSIERWQDARARPVMHISTPTSATATS